MALARLKIAIIEHKRGRLAEAERNYREFLVKHSADIGRCADREYLVAFAAYYLSQVAKKLEWHLADVPDMSGLRWLRTKASLPTRVEFPLPMK